MPDNQAQKDADAIRHETRIEPKMREALATLSESFDDIMCPMINVKNSLNIEIDAKMGNTKIPNTIGSQIALAAFGCTSFEDLNTPNDQHIKTALAAIVESQNLSLQDVEKYLHDDHTGWKETHAKPPVDNAEEVRLYSQAVQHGIKLRDTAFTALREAVQTSIDASIDSVTTQKTPPLTAKNTAPELSVTK